MKAHRARAAARPTSQTVCPDGTPNLIRQSEQLPFEDDHWCSRYRSRNRFRNRAQPPPSRSMSSIRSFARGVSIQGRGVSHRSDEVFQRVCKTELSRPPRCPQCRLCIKSGSTRKNDRYCVKRRRWRHPRRRQDSCQTTGGTAENAS